MSAKLKTLNTEMTDIADRLNVLVNADSRSEKDNADMDALVTRSEAVRSEIDREEKMQTKLAEIRTVADRGAPAASSGVQLPGGKITPMPFSYRKLRAFSGQNAEERAYRAGHWYLANLFGIQSSKRFCAEQGLEARAIPGQQEGDFALGGALVQPEILASIITLVETYGVYPSCVKNQPMKSEVLSIPRRVGGLKAFYIDEGNPFKESEAKWDRVTLTAKKVAVANRLTSEIIEDSIVSIGDVITEETGRAFAERVDIDGFTGDESADCGGHLGIVNAFEKGTHDASVITAKAGENSFETITLDSLHQMLGRLPVYARRNACWYISPYGYASMMQRLMLASGGTRPGDIAGDTPLSFMGFPVRLVLVMNSEAGPDSGQIKCLFGDMNLSSTMGIRRQMTMKVSDHRYAELDQILMLANTRWALLNHDLGTDTKVGPVMALKSA